MLAMKKGSMVWALNKDATLVQKTHGVLFPQMLLLYSNEDDFRMNREKPTKYFNLQRCLAIHPTDKYPGFFGIMLMLVPGGVDILGCHSEDERREWMEELNKAMDARIETSELADFIGTILDHRENPAKITDGQSPKPRTPDSNTKSHPSPKVAPVISPILIVPRSDDARDFSCPPMDLDESPHIESLIESSPSDVEGCSPGSYFKDFSKIPASMQSATFNNGSRSNAEKELKESVVQGRPSNGYSNESSNKTENSLSEGESIIDQVRSLNKMLISQEAANTILTESCDKIKDTLSVLYDRLRLKGVSVESAFDNTAGAPVPKRSNESSSAQDAPPPVSSHEAFATFSVVRRTGNQRRPRETVSLILPGEEEDSYLSGRNSSFLESGATSTQTLVAPHSRVQSPPNVSNPKVCVHCLKTVAVGILEVSMNLVTSQAPPSPQTIHQVQTLAAVLHSYLVARIRKVRDRTGLPSDVLIDGLSKIALNNPNSSTIVQVLIENAHAEVCGQILEEICLLDGKKEEGTTYHANGLASDWFKSIPEKSDIQWMLPGYIALCLLLYRLTECGSNKAKELDRPPEVTANNGNSFESQIESVLEALSNALSHDACQATGNDCTENDPNPNLQLGQVFESMFFEILLSKYDKNAIEAILPEVTDRGTINPDKLLSHLRSLDEMATSGELRSWHGRNNENDSSPKKQSSLTPYGNVDMHELEDLSAHRLENHQDFYDPVQKKKEARDIEEANQEEKDYVNVIAALKREHEEEKQQLLQEIKQSRLHRDYYDAYNNDSMSQAKDPHSLYARGGDVTSNSQKMNLTKTQEIIRDSDVILLDLVENAIDIFSKFVNSTMDRQEGLVDEDDGSDFNEIAARVPEALAGLEAAVTDLRSRLFNDIDGEEDDMVGEGPSHDANLPSSKFGRRLLHTQKTSPSPLGFTINLQETEDPDEVSESEV
ncbi:hypothetical protein Aperf_G00000016988 [Anoplocephala perfoliata]